MLELVGGALAAFVVNLKACFEKFPTTCKSTATAGVTIFQRQKAKKKFLKQLWQQPSISMIHHNFARCKDTSTGTSTNHAHLGTSFESCKGPRRHETESREKNCKGHWHTFCTRSMHSRKSTWFFKRMMNFQNVCLFLAGRTRGERPTPSVQQALSIYRQNKSRFCCTAEALLASSAADGMRLLCSSSLCISQITGGGGGELREEGRDTTDPIASKSAPAPLLLAFIDFTATRFSLLCYFFSATTWGFLLQAQSLVRALKVLQLDFVQMPELICLLVSCFSCDCSTCLDNKRKIPSSFMLLVVAGLHFAFTQHGHFWA